MQENNIFFVFKKSMLKHIFFQTSNIYFFRKRNVQNMLGYQPYATQKKNLYFFLSKTQASQLIVIKDNKQCAYILKVCKKTEQSRKKKIKDGLSKPNKKTFFFLIFLDWIQPSHMSWTGSNQTQPGYWPKPIKGLLI